MIDFVSGILFGAVCVVALSVFSPWLVRRVPSLEVVGATLPVAVLLVSSFLLGGGLVVLVRAASGVATSRAFDSIGLWLFGIAASMVLFGVIKVVRER